MEEEYSSDDEIRSGYSPQPWHSPRRIDVDRYLNPDTRSFNKNQNLEDYRAETSSLKVTAWNSNSKGGEYLTGLEAERVLINGMRKRVNSLKELIASPHRSPSHSLIGSSQDVRRMESLNEQGQNPSETEDTKKENCTLNKEKEDATSSKTDNIEKVKDKKKKKGFSRASSLYSFDYPSWQGVGGIKNHRLRDNSVQNIYLDAHDKTSRSSSLTSINEFRFKEEKEKVHIAVTEEGPKSSEPTFDTMFDYYSKWGNQDNVDSLSQRQFTKWLKNAGIIDKKIIGKQKKMPPEKLKQKLAEANK